ncbi:MAG: PqqD family protein [Pyrinomonadaceae bacterium]|nr:PqqD family protein [Pyrinomonadaceae bacterium]
MEFYPINRQSNIVIQELENEILIYDLNRNEAFCLNETAGIIWQLCDGTKTVAEISQAVGKKFNANVSEGFVWLALEQLKKDKLIESQVAPPTEFAGMNRREIVRKIGFASMVALPVVASLIAPISVNAQSCIAFLAMCNPVMDTCCPGSICDGMSSTCNCMCVNPGDCIVQTSCPSTVNCNMSGVCAP